MSREIKFKTDYTREELIAICEQAIVPESKWTDRDSYSSHKQIGECWALLKAGCRFEIEAKDPQTNDNTIWVRTWADGFGKFDWGGEQDEELSYLPTIKRLKKVKGGDWY